MVVMDLVISTYLGKLGEKKWKNATGTVGEIEDSVLGGRSG